MRYFLGIEVLKNYNGIYGCQRKYAHEVLERFSINRSNLVKYPIVLGCKLSKDEKGAKVDTSVFKEVVGSLMYLLQPKLIWCMVWVLSASSCCVLQSNIGLQQKRLLRYLKRTTDLRIFYKIGGCKQHTTYSDSDFVGDVDDNKSTSGCVFMFSSGAMSWSFKK